jgi:outer membrane lipase/esterase
MRGLLPALFAALMIGALSAGQAGAACSGLYVFGDSLSDTGNVNLLFGNDPLQVVASNDYVPDLPYAAGQFTNGDVWVWPFAAAEGLSSYAGPVLGSSGAFSRLGDFAFGGATTAVDGSVALPAVPLFTAYPPSLRSQVTVYISHLAAAGKSAPGDALFVLAGGGNDGLDGLDAIANGANEASTIETVANRFAAVTQSMVDDLHAAGARTVVVWNVPDFGLLPLFSGADASTRALATRMAQRMNNALRARLEGEPGVIRYDLFGEMRTVVANPSTFGLSNASDACGNALAGCAPSAALFWDAIHPTQAGHAIIAHTMHAAVHAVTEAHARGSESCAASAEDLAAAQRLTPALGGR